MLAGNGGAEEWRLPPAGYSGLVAGRHFNVVARPQDTSASLSAAKPKVESDGSLVRTTAMINKLLAGATQAGAQTQYRYAGRLSLQRQTMPTSGSALQ